MWEQEGGSPGAFLGRSMEEPVEKLQCELGVGRSYRGCRKQGPGKENILSWEFEENLLEGPLSEAGQG